MSENVSSNNLTGLYGSGGTPIPNANADVIVRGDLYVLSGNILTTASTGNIFPANVTTINLGLDATTLNIGANTGTTTINNNLNVDGTGTFAGDITATGGDFGNITVGLTDDQTITTTSGELRLGSSTSDIKLEGVNTLYTDQTTFQLLNSPTTVTAFDSATSLTLGETTGTTTIRNDLVVQGDVTADGGDFGNITVGITTNNTIDTTTGDLNLSSTNGVIGMLGVGTLYSDQSSFLLLNAPTTITAFDSATSLTMGETTGTTTIRNDLVVQGTVTAEGGDFGNVTVGLTFDNTIDTTTGPLYLSSNTGEIGMISVDTLYTDQASFLLLNSPTTVTAFDSATTLNLGDTTGTTFIRNDTTVGGDLKINGNTIKSNGATTAITLSGADVTLANDLTITGDTITLAQDTRFNYSENNDRANRPEVKSTTGNTSGWRVLAPNGTTSANANLTVFGSDDIDNGEFLNIQASGSTTAPFNVRTGTYTAGVLSASGKEIGFTDGNTLYASINPAGPTNNSDLVTLGSLTGGTLDPNFESMTISGSISGSSTFTAPSTGSNLSYVLPGTAGAVYTVLTNDGAGNLTWALPGGGGSTFGNITIAVDTDNTISTTSGNLILTGITGDLELAADTGILYPEGNDPFKRPYFQSTTGNSSGVRAVAPNTGTSSNASLAAINSSDTINAELISVQSWGSAITDPLRIVTGKYTAGVFGASGKSIAFRDGTTTYATTNPAGPSATTDLITLGSLIGGTLDPDFESVTISGTTSGRSTFAAPATGSTLSYVLPGSAGTANTVLTNDGSGNLTWALPGGGGSTFGNVSIGVDTDQTISTTSGNLILQTAAGASAGTMTLAAGANGAITLAPNGTGNVVNTFSNGGNLTNNRNYVFGAIRNATTQAAGDIWNFNATGAIGPTRGISLDNSSDTTKNPGQVIRSYSGSAATGQRPRLVFEKARNTAASPSANQAADLLGGIDITGYSSTGWVNDTVSAAPGNIVFVANENWVSNTNLGTGFSLNLAPTATTISSAANLVQALNINPQLNQSRSDLYTWANGKTTTTFSATGTSISGTTLTIGTVTAGTVQIGQFVQTAALGVLAGTYIVSNISGSGSGSTWVVSQTQTVGSTTFTGTSGAMYLNASGNLDTMGSITARGTSILGTNAGNNYASISSTGNTFTTTGRSDFIRTGSTAAQVPAILVRYSRTDQTGSQNNDGVDFRLGTGGTSTTDNIARFDAVYKSSGDNEIGMSVSTDSFAADTDRIYIGSRAKTQIQTTPSGGGSVGTTAEFTQLATTIKSDMLTLQTAAGVAQTSAGINYTRTYGEVAYTNAAGFDIPAQNTIYTMPLDTTLNASGVTISGTGNVNINVAGWYKIIMSLQITLTGSGSAPGQIDFWLRKNGADVPNSKTQVDLLKDQKAVIAMDWLVNSDGNDYWEIVYVGTTSNYADIDFPTVAATSTPYVSPVAPALLVNVIPAGM
jgi:hypothetical protein